jgi:L-ribulose-5-phosphate 3-epimerase
MKLGTIIRIANISQCENQFQKVRDLGLEACQVVYKPKVYTREDADRIREAADKVGLEISAQFCGYYDNATIWDLYYGYLTAGLNVEAYKAERLRYLCEAAEFVSWIGISDMVIHAGFTPNNPFAPEYATMLASIEFLARKCESLGVNILFETGAESPITLLRLIEDVGRDNLYINLDPANILMYGYGNPVDAVYTFGKYVRNIHGKDGVPPTNPRQLGAEMPVGKGEVNFFLLFKRLKDLGYDRYIIIERETTGEEQVRDIILAKEYFEKLMIECGW